MADFDKKDNIEYSEKIVNLYDWEIYLCKDLWERLNYKWKDRQNNKENIMQFNSETIQRFEEIGFDVEIDFVDYVLDVSLGKLPPTPPTLIINGRMTPTGEFDHEHKKFEVIESRKKGGI